MRSYILLLFTIIWSDSFGQSEINFTNIDSTLRYALGHSLIYKSNLIQKDLAHTQYQGAIVNLINFRNPIAFTMTDNAKLPVNFIPAQLLGGPASVYKEMTLGVQYVSNLSSSPQIDLINIAAWDKLKREKSNEDLVQLKANLNERDLQLSIIAAYYNILMLKRQLAILDKNINNADTILRIAGTKYQSGVIRKKDVNDAQINYLNLVEKKQQSQLTLEQQLAALRYLCNVTADIRLSLSEALNDYTGNRDFEVHTTLDSKIAATSVETARYDWASVRKSQLPVLSAFFSDSYVQSSDNSFFDKSENSTRWINVMNFGLKLSVNFPDPSKNIQVKTAALNLKLAEQNLESVLQQEANQNIQTKIDFAKAQSQVKTNTTLIALYAENYEMAVHQYDQGILSFDKLLEAFNNKLNNEFNLATALGNLYFIQKKIQILNQ